MNWFGGLGKALHVFYICRVCGKERVVVLYPGHGRSLDYLKNHTDVVCRFECDGHIGVFDQVGAFEKDQDSLCDVIPIHGKDQAA